MARSPRRNHALSSDLAPPIHQPKQLCHGGRPLPPASASAQSRRALPGLFGADLPKVMPYWFCTHHVHFHVLCLCGIFLSYVVFPIQANRAKKEKKKCHLFVRRTQIAVTFLIQNSFVWICDPGGGGKKKQQRIHVLVESSLQLTACLHSGLSHTGKRQESPLVSLALLAHAW